MAFRIDIGTTLRPPRYLADGGACFDATLTRTGVFIYRDANGKEFREYRPADEVFKPESMDSFRALPITDDHPNVMVDATNRDTFKRGRAGDTIVRDGINMIGAIIVDDAGLLAKMKAGKNQVSNGYTCDLEMTPGVSPEGERYDAIQRNIRGNHIAIVDAGRAGTARVRMDEAAYQIDSPTTSTAAHSSEGLVSTRADSSMEIAQMDELKKQLDAALANLATETARANVEKTRADGAEKQRDAEKLRADSADKARTDAETAKAKADADREAADKLRADAVTSEPKRVAERVKLETNAARVLGADAKIKRADNSEVTISDALDREIKCAVIKKVDGIDVKTDAEPTYVAGRFDSACERAEKGASALASVRTVVQGGNPKRDLHEASKTDDDEEIMRKKMIKDSANAYKTAPRVQRDGDDGQE